MIDIEKLEQLIEQGKSDEAKRILEGGGAEEGARRISEARQEEIASSHDLSRWSDEPRIQFVRGLLAFRRGRYRESIEYLNDGLDLVETIGPKKLEYHIKNYLIWIGLKAGGQKLIRKLFNELGRHQNHLGPLERAFFFVNHANAVSSDIGFIESEKFSDRLLKDASDALKSAEKITARKDVILFLRTQVVKGILLQQLEHWDEAVSLLGKAITLARSEGYVLLEADLLEELGNLYYRRAEELRMEETGGVGSDSGSTEGYEDAMDSFQQALEIWAGVNRDQEGVLHSALGDAMYRLGNFGSSWDHHKVSREIFQELDYPHGEGLQMAALGRVTLRKAEQKDGSERGMLKDGIAYLKKAYRIFKKLDVRHEMLLTRVYLVDGYFLLSRKKGKKELEKLLYNEPVKRYLDCYRELKEVVNREDWLREDPELKELFQKPLPRYITLELLEQIIQAAKRSHPNEFGGLIHGDPVMDRLEFVLDSAKGKDTFMFSLYNRYSGDYMYADGSVHSHPSGAAIPSKADLSFFGKFPNVNIIIGYPYALDSWAAYDRNGNKVTVSVIYRQDKERVEVQMKKMSQSGSTSSINSS